MALQEEVMMWRSPVLQEIWAENTAVREALWADVQGLTEAQIAFQPAPGKWSIGEILDHLSLSEQSIGRTVSKILQVAAGRGLIGESGSMQVPARPIDLSAYNQTAKAPDFVRPSPGRPLDQLLSGLQDSRRRVIEVTRRADGRVVGNVTIPHVRLGELHFYQWLTLEGAHEAKHLEQIRQIRFHPDFPKA